MKDCIFCQIVKGKSPAHKVWQDKNHLSFLTIFPNTEAFTVVITKKHFGSNFTKAPDEVLKEIIIAAKKTAQKILKAYPETERVGLVIEGEGVDHLHVKLIPMHPNSYKGFLTTKGGKRADNKKLAQIAKRIRTGE